MACWPLLAMVPISTVMTLARMASAMSTSSSVKPARIWGARFWRRQRGAFLVIAFSLVEPLTVLNEAAVDLDAPRQGFVNDRIIGVAGVFKHDDHRLLEAVREKTHRDLTVGDGLVLTGGDYLINLDALVEVLRLDRRAFGPAEIGGPADAKGVGLKAYVLAIFESTLVPGAIRALAAQLIGIADFLDDRRVADFGPVGIGIQVQDQPVVDLLNRRARPGILHHRGDPHGLVAQVRSGDQIQPIYRRAHHARRDRQHHQRLNEGKPSRHGGK